MPDLWASIVRDTVLSPLDHPEIGRETNLSVELPFCPSITPVTKGLAPISLVRTDVHVRIKDRMTRKGWTLDELEINIRKFRSEDEFVV